MSRAAQPTGTTGTLVALVVAASTTTDDAVDAFVATLTAAGGDVRVVDLRPTGIDPQARPPRVVRAVNVVRSGARAARRWDADGRALAVAARVVVAADRPAVRAVWATRGWTSAALVNGVPAGVRSLR
ncbi:hypothetical protein [Cellulomonas composti]|uniref:Uncharacterized protein n=1 Tax=Cellulomonas composti TaxID=266130 RepID=A0A511JB04_9CELL|nr:hypothetical protein [Cellulomonas composti]GEL95170.1 hypothetical protein CCO02nite_18280 [Cellulomonas composti]